MFQNLSRPVLLLTERILYSSGLGVYKYIISIYKVLLKGVDIEIQYLAMIK